MTKLNGWKMGCTVLLLCAAATVAAQAQIFTTIFDFDGNDGASPSASLVQGRLGTLYGTTARGGDIPCTPKHQGCGTVYEITPEGELTVLHKFAGYPTDGSFPTESLVLAIDGSFWGTTALGGANDDGTIFRITQFGRLTILYSFCSQADCADGEGPSRLVQAIDGNFYGTTSEGGEPGCGRFDVGCGTVFRITPEGNLTTVHTFQGSDGATPSGLFLGTDGNLLGTTAAGGAYGEGTAFKMSLSGALTTLYNFCAQTACADGSSPAGGLVQAIGENFFGTTNFGGTSPNRVCQGRGCGTIFRLTPQGVLTTLYNFCVETDCADGIYPLVPLIQATDGNLYGTTSYGGNLGCGRGHGCGTLFSITLQGELTTVHTFDDGPERGLFGAAPSGLIQATSGDFYGTNAYGGLGSSDGFGTLYSLSMGLDPFVSLQFDLGKIGQPGGILGQGLTGTSGVSFNGTPAKFTVVSDTYLTATVPQGATTGYVTVTTPTGVLTSNVPFHVIP